jgi:hypothetical protein
MSELDFFTLAQRTEPRMEKKQLEAFKVAQFSGKTRLK